MDGNDRRAIVNGIKVMAEHGKDAAEVIRDAIEAEEISQNDVDEAEAWLADLATA